MVKKAKNGEIDAVELLMKIEYTLDSFASRNGFMFGQSDERSDEWGFYE
jgi:CRISPR/Cas system CMR-associated protein Cmr3 (group 5 of RAMP superfamily)